MVVTLTDGEARTVIRACQAAMRWYYRLIDGRLKNDKDTADLEARVEEFAALEDKVAGELGL